MAKETAEQKLLKLIEAQDGAPAASSDNPAQQIAQSVKSTGIQVPLFMKGLPALFKNLPGRASEIAFGLPQINAALFAVVAVVLLFLAVSLIQGARLSQRSPDFEIASPGIPSGQPLVTSAKDVAEYVAPVQARNIFYPFQKKATELSIEATANQQIAEKIKDLRLVGISWLDSAESATAMIEDTKTSITHFLKPDDEINGVKVKEIYADRITVTYGGEVTTIKL